MTRALRRVLLFSVMSAPLFLACAGECRAAGPRKLSREFNFTEMVRQEQQLAVRVLKPLIQQNVDGNIVFAPLPLLESLVILHSAAQGETRSGLESVLGDPRISAEAELLRRARDCGWPVRPGLPVELEANDGYGVRLKSSPPETSGAWMAGLRQGDLIFSVQGEPVRKPEELLRSLDEGGRTTQLGGYDQGSGLPFESRTVRLDGIPDRNVELSRRPARFAVGLWLRTGLRVQTEWAAELKDRFEARLVTSAAGDAAAVEQLWQSVFKDSLAIDAAPRVPDLPPAAAFLLLNGLVIDVSWLLPFPPQATAPGTFRAPRGTLEVPFMRLTARFGYTQVDGWQVIELPCRDSSLVCRLMLPPDPEVPDRNSTSDRQAVSAAPVHGLSLASVELKPQIVELKVPRFEFQSDVSLNEILKSLGASQAWSDAADFSRMTGDRSVRLDEVRQDVRISFHERGVRVVAANTSTGVLKGLEPEPAARFLADRPFLFSIQDSSGLILAAGRVTHPTPADADHPPAK